MSEIHTLLESLYSTYSEDVWSSGIDRLLRLTAHAPVEQARVLALAARHYYAVRVANKHEHYTARAHELASRHPETAPYYSLLEAYTLMNKMQPRASNALLESLRPVEHLLDRDNRSWLHAVHGRNEDVVGNYVTAIESSQEAIAISPADPGATAVANMTLSHAFQSMSRYEESDKYGRECLQFVQRVEYQEGIASVSAFLGVVALDRDDPDAARTYREAVARARMQEQPNQQSLGWMSYIHFRLGEFDAATDTVQRAIDLGAASGDAVNLAFGHLLLGRIHMEKGNMEHALQLFESVMRSEELLGDIQRMTLYRSMARALRELGRKEETADICWKLWELQRDFDSRTHAALLSYQVRLEKKLHQQNLELLQLRTNQLERELSHTASQLIARTELLTKFRDEIQGILRTGTDPAATIRGIRDKLKGLPVEEMNWTTFDAQFMSVHPEFTSNLLSRCPDLSQAEVRLCKLLRLNLTSSEIARLFSLSERTIETQRFAVRKKLGLKRSENVADALATI